MLKGAIVMLCLNVENSSALPVLFWETALCRLRYFGSGEVDLWSMSRAKIYIEC